MFYKINVNRIQDYQAIKIYIYAWNEGYFILLELVLLHSTYLKSYALQFSLSALKI